LSAVSFLMDDLGGMTPTFAESVQLLDSSVIEIEGYMLPLTVDNDLFILSRYPFSECFFCGAAGKETVMELKPKKPFEFDVDEPVKVRGRLRLETDPMQLAYVLEDAVLVP
ncbi:MAG: hypothetical protein AAFV07_02120, partial [Bacteroidota bacterium]